LAIARAVQERITEANSKAKPKEVKQFAPLQSFFIRPGQALDSKKKVTKKDAPHLLQAANDWKCDFDLPEFRSPGSAYVFPHAVCLTTTKIDGYIISESARICIGLELTCPMEENLAKQHSFKQQKYEELASEAGRNGWRFEKLIVEVGARGFVPSHVHKALTRLDIRAKSLINKLVLLAQKCSYVIWINRFNKEFQTWRLVEK
jgi:hypothetical protein